MKKLIATIGLVTLSTFALWLSKDSLLYDSELQQVYVENYVLHASFSAFEYYGFDLVEPGSLCLLACKRNRLTGEWGEVKILSVGRMEG